MKLEIEIWVMNCKLVRSGEKVVYCHRTPQKSLVKLLVVDRTISLFTY